MQILKTDDGPHPADKWAVATARELVPTDGVGDGLRMIQALKLQAAVAEVLEGHHQGVHDAERAGLAADGSNHLLTPFDSSAHVPDALAAIVAASKGTPWEDHWLKPEVRAAAAAVLDNHFNTGADIERQWHADRNPGCPIAAAFKRQTHPGDAPGA